MKIWHYLSLVSLMAFPLVLGSAVARPHLLLPQLLVLLVLIAAWTLGNSDREYSASRLVQWIFLAWGGIGLLQSIPLPPALVGWISPATLEGRQAAVDLLDISMGWIPLTLSPSHTLFHSGIFLAAGLAAPMWSGLFRSKQALSWLLGGFTAIGTFLVLFGLVQMLLPSSLRFESVAPNSLGFNTLLMNGNNLSSFLFLSMGSAFSLMFMAKRGRWRLLAGLLGVISGVGIVLSLSRAGIALLVVVNVLAVLLFARSRLEEEGSILRVVELLFPLAFVLAFVFLLADIHVVIREFDQTDAIFKTGGGDANHYMKTYVWILSLEESTRYLFGGVGIGAFQVAANLFLNSGTPVIYPAAENIAVQQIMEAGWLFGTLLTIGLFWISIRPLLRFRNEPALYPVALTLFAVFVGDFFDFGFYTPGVFLSWAAMASVLNAIATSSDEEKVPPSRWRLLLVPGALLAAFSLILGYGYLPQRSLKNLHTLQAEDFDSAIHSYLAFNPFDAKVAMNLASVLDSPETLPKKKALYEFAAYNLANAFYPRLALARLAENDNDKKEMVHQLDLALESCPPKEPSCMKAMFQFPAPTTWFSGKLKDPNLAVLAIYALAERHPPSAWELSRIRFSMDDDLEWRVRDTEIRCTLAKNKNSIPEEMCKRVLETAIKTAPKSPEGILYSIEIEADLLSQENKFQKALNLYPIVASGTEGKPSTCRCLEKMLQLHVNLKQIDEAQKTTRTNAYRVHPGRF